MSTQVQHFSCEADQLALQIPACPIKELADVANDQHVAHDRKMIVEVEVLSFSSLPLQWPSHCRCLLTEKRAHRVAAT
jgi:crotonobetainyl-CoA:carnitine CoA-transferase CaiB-like acyl-CoA transferase